MHCPSANWLMNQERLYPSHATANVFMRQAQTSRDSDAGCNLSPTDPFPTHTRAAFQHDLVKKTFPIHSIALVWPLRLLQACTMAEKRVPFRNGRPAGVRPLIRRVVNDFGDGFPERPAQ